MLGALARAEAPHAGALLADKLPLRAIPVRSFGWGAAAKVADRGV